MVEVEHGSLQDPQIQRVLTEWIDIPLPPIEWHFRCHGRS